MSAERAWITTFLVLLSSHFSSSQSIPFYSISFVSDTSSLFYRSVPIKSLIDKAESSNSSLKLDITATASINFGLLKCGSFVLATTSKIQKATYFFYGLSLKSLDQIISRGCASDTNKESFDIVINSKNETRVHLNFSISAESMSPEEDSSINLNSMYPFEIHFNVPPLSHRLYPIQMKAIARGVVQDKGSVLQVSTNTGLPIEFMIRRCQWEVPGLEIYDQNHARNILQLTERSCESEWLVDSVNIHIQNQNTESITGVLHFDKAKGFTYKTAPAESFPELNTVLPVVALNVKINSKFSSLDSWSIAVTVLFAICVSVKIVAYFGFKFYIGIFKHGSYNVWERSHQYSEALIDV